MFYICFLDSLINHSDDVKEVRSAGVLLNNLGSDKDAADLINQMTGELVDCNEYFEVMREIRRFSNRKARTWMAEMLNTHFSTPWTAIAFFVGLLLILLTIFQTCYTMFPPV
uniref:Uncharacterized protein n=1 Tax=Nelumbo nucifera TaxID=4432 RepID=A0A822ZDT8_NELNU|nr:TPA_asm: hypothetical protein HUJ06_000900 [Nelumbo nucifera]